MTSIQKGRLKQPRNSAGKNAYSEGHFVLTFIIIIIIIIIISQSVSTMNINRCSKMQKAACIKKKHTL
jgi:hypothetical protein